MSRSGGRRGGLAPGANAAACELVGPRDQTPGIGTRAGVTSRRVDDLLFDDLEFPLAWCEPCGREVLTATAGDDRARCCVHCGAEIDGSVRQARGADLADRGYALYEESGCGRPGCGGGRCGSRG